MQRFISYIRVSTQRQGQSGLGLDAQREAIRNYVRSVGGEIVEEFSEIESGSVRDRPILVQSIARCRSDKAILVMAKLDRLARNVAFVSALMETGVEFVAVDAPFANKLFVHILAAFAEHERTMISERTKAALAAAKARGIRLGSNGQALAKRNRDQAKQFAETARPLIENAMCLGAKTLAQIADKLNEERFLTREGSAQSPATVQRMLRRLGLTTKHMRKLADQGGKPVRVYSQCDETKGFSEHRLALRAHNFLAEVRPTDGTL